MIKKILFTLLIILLIVGCKPATIEKNDIEESEQVSEDVETSESISEVDDIIEITDTETEEELDKIDGLLNDW